MNGKDFASMIQGGIRPAVAFTKEIEELEAYAENGMRARVLDAEIQHDDVVLLTVDYSEFDEFNKQFESTNYYDEAGNPTKTAREAGFYKPQEKLYIGADSEIPFVIEESGRLKLYDRFRNEGAGLSYVQWLEDQVLASAGWQPIETAPKDGTDVWLYLPDDEPSQAVGYFDGTDPDNQFWAYREALVMDVMGAASPTRWMPLPAKHEG